MIALKEEDSVYEEENFQESITLALPNFKVIRNVHEGVKPAREIEFSNENTMSGFVECVICDISFFGTSSTLEKHISDVHKGQKKLENIADDIKILSQKQEDNPSIEFSCKYCSKCFTQWTLDKHLRFCDKRNTQYHGPLEQQVNFFNEEAKGLLDTKQNENMVQHNPRQYLDKEFSCNYCDQVFTQYNLDKHIRFCEKSYSPSLKYQIDVVHEKAKQLEKSRMDQSYPETKIVPKNDCIQETVHRGPKKFNCNLCDKSYTQSHNLNAHIKSAHEGLKFPRQSCEKIYSHSQNLKIHIKTVHELDTDTKIVPIKNIHEVGNTNTYYTCEICDKKYDKKHKLKFHISYVHEEIRVSNTYTCEICDKKYDRKHKLKSHISYVHEEIRLTCHLCDKKFASICGLKDHVLYIHKEKKKIIKECEICNKVYFTTSGLRYHKRVMHISRDCQEDWDTVWDTLDLNPKEEKKQTFLSSL